MHSEPELTQLHCELLYLLKQFHKFCVDHDIKYSVHGGTLLGAVREKGFIPWDDDVDVTLSRADYNKLKNTMEKCKGEIDFFFDDHSSCRIPKVLIRRHEKPVVWLDLFIYDFISEGVIAQKIKKVITVFFLAFTKTKSEMKATKVGIYKGWKYHAIHLCYLIGRLFPIKFKQRLRDWFAVQTLNGKKKLIFRSNDQYIGIRHIFPCELLSEYILLPFEDTEVMAFKDFEDILINSYGTDYMIPRKNDIVLTGHDITRQDFS